MYELVNEAEQVLVNKDRDLDDFGRLLDTTWKLKKGTGSSISTGSIDELYDKGNESRGSWGQTSRRWRRRIFTVLCSTGKSKAS